MMSFYEYIAQDRKIRLPDAHTMLSMAGIGLDFPNEEETKRLLNSEKKRPPSTGRVASGTVHAGRVPPASPAVRRPRSRHPWLIGNESIPGW